MRIKCGESLILKTLALGAVIFCILCSPVNSQAQILSNAYSNANATLNSFFSEDIPGAFNAAMPLLFPPYFGGEIRIRPTSMNLMKGEAKLGTSNGFGGQDKWYDLEIDKYNNQTVLGLSSKGSYIETMLRLQFSRLSLRGYVNAYLREIPATDGDIDWFTYRFGADLDIVNSYGFRIGPAIDLYPETFTTRFYNLERDGKRGISIKPYSPVTIGFYAAYNPFTSWAVSPTAEIRFQWPWPYRQGEELGGRPLQLTNWEYAVGLKLPKTVLGSTGIRFGYTETKVEFAGGKGSSNRGIPVSIQWSGIFGELVWLY